MKTSRRLNNLWQDYCTSARTEYPSHSTLQLESPALLAFLDLFMFAAADELDCRAECEQSFAQCDELLDVLLHYLTAYLETEQPPAECPIRLLTKVLQALELLLRTAKYRAFIESSPEVINNVLRLFERVTNNEVRVSALRLIASIGITPESRVEICSRDGFKKVLQLMLDKDEDLSKEVARTVKHFLHTKVQPLQTRLPAPTLRQKVKKVFKGVARLASTMFPPDVQPTGSEIPIQSEGENLPPTEKLIRKATEDFEARKVKFVSDEQHSASSTPIQSQVVPSNVDTLKESMRVQGVLATIVKALQQTAMEVQLDLMETLSILLANNVRNQHEFSKLQGYQFISELFDKVKDYGENPSSARFLESCFGILQTIITGDERVVQNFSALEVVLHLTATSAQVPVAAMAVGCLRKVIELSWENAIAVLDSDLEKYLLALLTRSAVEGTEGVESGCAFTPLGNYERQGEDYMFVAIGADARVSFLREVDQLMRCLAFVMGSSGAHNSKVPALYISLLRKATHSMSQQVRDLLLSSLAAFVADLNARMPRASVTSLDRGTFLSAWVGLEHCASALTLCYPLSRDLSLRVLAHLARYSLLYRELTLNSEFMVERCLVRPVLESREVMSDIVSRSKDSPEVAWVLESTLQSGIGCVDLNWVLDALLGQGSVSQVAKLLMLQECPIVQQARGVAFRKAFLRDSVLDFVQERLKTEEVIYLLLSACWDSQELKQYAVGYITPIFLADELPANDLGLHALMDLCTEQNYLYASGFLSHVTGTLPVFSGPLYQQVAFPSLLFDVPHLDHESSSSSSSISTPSLSTANSISGQLYSGYESLKLIEGENLHSLLRFLMRVDRSLQSTLLHNLTLLTHSFHNKRVLHRLQAGKSVLSTLAKLSPDCQEAGVQLLERVFSYSMSLDDSDALLRVLAVSDHPLRAMVVDLACKLLRLELASEFLAQAYADIQTATLTAFPAAKTGYTVMFWVKVRRHCKDFQPLFTWVNHSRGLVLFKLCYKHKGSTIDKRRNPPLRPVAEGLKHKIHYSKSHSPAALSAQVLSMLSPAQDNSKHYEWELSKDWTHICFTHDKNGLTLYIDSQPQEVYKCGYLNLMKDKVCVTAVLGGERTEALFTKVMCLETAVEKDVIRRIVTQGVTGTGVVGEQKVLFLVPEKRTGGNPFPEAADSQSQADPWPHFFPRDSLNRDAPDSVIHLSTTPKEAFSQASALAHFFSLIHSGDVSIGLRLVCHYITQNEQNYNEFSEKYDWHMLSTCLHRYADKVTAETIDFLIDAVCNSLMVHLKLRKMLTLKIHDVPEVPVNRVNGLSLALDLVSSLSPDITVNLLEALSSLMTIPSNVQLFLSSEVNGLQFMLNLLKAIVQPENRPLSYYLLATFERVLPYFGPAEVETFLDFLTSPDLKHHLSLVESEVTVVLSFISIHVATGNSALLDKLLAADAGLLAFDLLGSPSESLRCAAIKMIGLFLKTNPRYKAWFSRKRGFDMMLTVLQKHRHSQQTYQLLFDFATSGLDKVAAFYPPDSGNAKTIMNRSTIADKTLPQPEKEKASKRLVHVEVLEVLLELLKLEDDETVKFDSILCLESLLDPENCELLLECPFISWCSGLVKSDSQKPAVGSARAREDRYQSQLYDLVTKLCAFDLYRSPKQFKFQQWLNKLPDMDFFYVRVFEGILSEVERGLETRKVDSNCLKNLATLLQINELPSFHPRLVHRVMHLVNNLACGSTPAVRSQMKSLGLFDLRDTLLIHLLRTESSAEEMMELLTNFSLDGLASQSRFRDSQAIFYLLKCLLETDSADLQREILRCLIQQICTQEDNRKQLKKTIESKALLQYLFNERIVEAQSAIGVCFKSMKTAKMSQEDEELPEVNTIQNISESDFCEWLNSSDSRRKTLLLSVQKALATVDIEVKKSQSRLAEVRSMRRKRAIDALLRDRTSVQKQVHELGLKLMMRLARSEERCRESLRTAKELTEMHGGDLARKSI